MRWCYMVLGSNSTFAVCGQYLIFCGLEQAQAMDYGSARNVLISGKEVDIQNLKEIRDLPEKQKKGREKEIRSGAEFLQTAPRFPSRRGCKDLPWAILFMLTVAALVAFVIYSVVGINTELNEDEDFKHWKTHDGKVPPDIWSDAITINLACVAGSVAGLIMAFFWIMAAKACPSPVVYISPLCHSCPQHPGWRCPGVFGPNWNDDSWSHPHLGWDVSIGLCDVLLGSIHSLHHWSCWDGGKCLQWESLHGGCICPGRLLQCSLGDLAYGWLCCVHHQAQGGYTGQEQRCDESVGSSASFWCCTGEVA